jgi:hypothetical protein
VVRHSAIIFFAALLFIPSMGMSGQSHRHREKARTNIRQFPQRTLQARNNDHRLFESDCNDEQPGCSADEETTQNEKSFIVTPCIFNLSRDEVRSPDVIYINPLCNVLNLSIPLRI